MADKNLEATRRTLIKTVAASGALGFVGSTAAQSSNPLGSIATDAFADAVVDTTYTGQEVQQAVHSQSAHGYPQDGDSYLVLSNGDAGEIFGDPDDFQSTDAQGIQIQNYSPDGYVANDVATFVIDFTVPEGAENVAFDYKFGTEENPTYLESQYQDFFEAVVIPPDEEPRNIALLPDGNPVTVQNSDSYANSPEGSSQAPNPPFPSSPDTVFNSVTEQQTAIWNVSEYQGEEVTLFLRIADASDFAFDSAVFIDDLRFTGDVQTDPNLPRVSAALDNYEDALFGAIDEQLTAVASTEAKYYNEHGSEYTSTITDYLAYKAGDEDSADVDDELRTLLDEAVSSSLDASSASELQSFYEEMYGAASSDMSESQLSSLFYQYYRGTADGQSSYLRFDTSGSETDTLPVAADSGQTLEELVEFTQDCIVGAVSTSGLKEEILQEIAASDLSAAAIEKFAQTIEDQTENLNNQIEITSTRYNETADTLTSDEEFEAKIVVPDTDQSAAESDQVESQLAATTGIVGGFAVKTLLTSGTAKAAGLTLGAGGLSLAGANYLGATSAANGLSASTYTGGQIAGAGSALSSAQSLASAQTMMHYTRVQAIVNYLKLIDTATGALECGTTAFQDFLDAVDAMESASDENGDLPDVDIIDLSISDVEAEKVQAEDQLSDSNLGRGSGSATITNDGVVPIRPNFSDSKVNETIAYTSIQTGTEHPLVFDDIPEIQPGESVTIEFTYLAPVGGLFELVSDYEIEITEQQTGASETTTFDTEAIDFDLDIPTTTVDQGSISTGETVSRTTSTSVDASRSTFKLDYEEFDGDLHLYDENGNHCGFDYEAGEVVNEIPGATYFGDNNGTTKQEYITVSEPNGSEYTVEVTVEEIGTIIQSVETNAGPGSSESTSREQQLDGDATPMAVSPIDDLASGAGSTEYTTELTELIPQPGAMNVAPVSVATTPPEEVATSLTVSEIGTFEDLQSVNLSLGGDLEQTDGSATLDQGNVTFESQGITVESGESEEISVTITVPDGTATGTYEGNITATATSPSGSVTQSASLTVEVAASDYSDWPTDESVSQAIDTDGDGELSLDELRGAVQGWQNGELDLTLGELRELVYYWQS